MGCPSFVIIGKDLKFSICTHDPDTVVLTDADAAPAYRIYEDENATAIATGNMAKLDDANTTGFYTEIISCTAVAGYEDGKTYSIYIEATVSSDKGGISFEFTAYDRLPANVTMLAGNAAAATQLSKSARSIGSGTVCTDNEAATTTTFQCDDITEQTANHMIGRAVIFYDSGDALYWQATEIEGYSWDAGNGESVFTVTEMTEAPSNNDVFVIV